jgi:hypothetical protein
MKMRTILAVLVLWCVAASAQTQKPVEPDDCLKYEYAELKDMSKKELLANFCTYTALEKSDSDLFDIRLKHWSDASDLLRKYSPALPPESVQVQLDEIAEIKQGAEAERIQAAKCGVEEERISQILERRFQVKKFDCSSLEKKPSKAAPAVPKPKP